MMKVVVLVALLAVCSAQDAPSAAAKLVLSPQDKFLSRDAVGNFACRIDSVSVETVGTFDEDKAVITKNDIEDNLSMTATLEWAHVPQFFFSSSDGRNDEKSLSTPGGDLGEFIQGLEAFTKVTGTVLTDAEVDQALARHLKTMSRNKFFFETDEKAYKKLAIATGCQNLQIAQLADKRKRVAILSKFAGPDAADFIGDPYIKFLFQNAQALGIRREYIVYAIQAFHNNLWRTTSDSDKLCYLEVKGHLSPNAIIHVRTPTFCVDQGLAPLISGQSCNGQVLINYPDAVKLYRREIVTLLARPGRPEDEPQEILSSFNSIAQANQEKFFETFGAIPKFAVTFSHSTELLKNNVAPVEESL